MLASYMLTISLHCTIAYMCVYAHVSSQKTFLYGLYTAPFSINFYVRSFKTGASSGITDSTRANKRIGQAWRRPVCHMFLLCGCGPYVSIGWLWPICFYCVAVDHMFLLRGARPYVSIVCVTICFHKRLL